MSGSSGNDQRVVVALALLAGDAGPVSVLCQFARAPVSAAEHVGKQIEGVAGCRASAGSGGMAGGCDELVDALLQAASGSTSSKSIRESCGTLLVRIVGDLRLCCGAALFFGAGCGDGCDLSLLRGDGRRAHAVGVTFEVAGAGRDRECDDECQPEARVE
ncbi:hypothetical protein WS89_31290 [Burkholderia sp. MSMB1072]|nr:hypothetical protein WS89_31290 [Burkholderia sp. MSMB1072]